MLQGAACDRDIGTVAVRTLKDTYLKGNIDRCTEALAAQITVTVERYSYLGKAGLVLSGFQLKTILILASKLKLM